MDTIENEIIRIIDRYRAAVRNRDAEAFMALYSPDVRVLDLWETWVHDTLTWKESVRQWFAGLNEETVHVDAEAVQMRSAHGMAMASAIMTYAAVSPAGETLRSMQNRLTWVLMQQGNAWLIVHEHTSVPIDPHGLKAIMQCAPRP